jgi:hypothetical protein
MRRERPLPVGRSLHGPENLFEIQAHAPGVYSRRFCEAHSAEHGEARSLVLRMKAGRLGQTGLNRIPHNSEVLRSQARADFLRISQELAVQRRKPLLGDFPPFCLRRVEFRPVANLASTQVLGDSSDSSLHVAPAQTQRLAAISDSSNDHVNMRVLGVVVLHRDPFEFRSEIVLHAFDQIAGQAGQIDPITEFRRDDQFPHLFVSRGLPAFELPGNVDCLTPSIESHGLGVVFECGALARKVAPVRFPLPSRLVLQIHHANGATLMV